MSQPFVDIVNRFSFQLQSLAFDPDKSSGLCAMNIYHCLAMVAAGSKDKNLGAFGEAMGFAPGDLDDMVKNTVQLDKYCKGSPDVDFSSASSIWHRNGFILQKPWEETVRNTFGATVGPLQLEPINAFINHETRGKFKDLVQSGDIANAVLMLITCLYFKATWAEPFETSKTQKQANFHTFDRKVQSCAMMNKVKRMEYVENGKMQVCILPYKSSAESRTSGPNWKAAIVLPKNKGPEAMKNILTEFSTSSDVIRTLLKGPTVQAGPNTPPMGLPGPSARPPRSPGGPIPLATRPTTLVSLSLPRFSLKLHLDLIPQLVQLGLRPAFEPSMDFSPISNGSLLITRATHDLFIEVNEKGTEMAAVTIIAARSRTSITEMKVDRPFLFVVFDEISGLVLCAIVVNSVSNAEDGTKS